MTVITRGEIHSRLLDAVLAAAPGATGLSVETHGDPSSVRVSPPEFQAAAQAAIDSFDWSADAHQQWVGVKNPERKGLADDAAQSVANNTAFLANPAPTNPQVAAQVRRLSQQVNRIIARLVQLN